MYLKVLPGNSHIDTEKNHEILTLQSHKTDLDSKYVLPNPS
jgi:hypothetical protein